MCSDYYFFCNFAGGYPYMKGKTLLTLSATICLTLASCFKDEPLNAECDIEKAYVHVDNPSEFFYNLTDSIVTVASDASIVTFKVRDSTDLTALSPIFILTEGATISPLNGSTHDFSSGSVTYTVTSEDGAWSRVYEVRFRTAEVVPDTVCYDFERFFLNSSGQYYEWSDLNDDGTEANNWATANAGFALSRSTATWDEYPTVPIEDGYDGWCVKLETCSTGAFGEMVNKRLAAGNLFLGTFDISVALTSTLDATCFGLPFTRRPITFSGYYKYLPATAFQDTDGSIIDARDGGRFYAVFYLNHDENNNEVVLHGDDVMTNENIVAIADGGVVYDEVEEWTYFEFSFEYGENEIDYDLLTNQGYSIAIVCSSSDQGAYYQGAIGSKLYVDKFRIICETIE